MQLKAILQTVNNLQCYLQTFSGCSLVRLKCASGGRESGGSNPLTPTYFSLSFGWAF